MTKWKITDKPGVSSGSDGSVEYLSVDIVAMPDGYSLNQAVYTRDLLQKRGMTACRPLGNIEDVS